MTFGGNHGNGSPRVEAFYQNVDAMLVAGSRLRLHETQDFSVKLPKTLVHADIDPAANGRTYRQFALRPWRCRACHRQPGEALEGRVRSIPATLPTSRTPRSTQSRSIRKFPASTAASARRSARSCRATRSGRATSPSPTPLGATASSQSTIRRRGCSSRCCGNGAGLPLGIGAALGAGEGRKTVTMVGDGGFALGLCELWTATQERARRS